MEISKENDAWFKVKAFLDENELTSEITKDASKISININGIVHVLKTKEFLFLQSFMNRIAVNLYEEADNEVYNALSNEDAYEYFENSIKFEFITLSLENASIAKESESIIEDVEHFEEEIPEFKFKQEPVIDIDSMLGVTSNTILEEKENIPEIKEEINEVKSVSEEIKESKELTTEEFNTISEKVFPETKPDTLLKEDLVEEISIESIVTEMRDYGNLHQREFEDLSKLLMTADIIVSPGDLTKIKSLLNANSDILNIIESSKDEETISSKCEDWNENSIKIISIHREYFRTAKKEAQKVLVQGVFEAFNSFSVENRIELMQEYSKFLGEEENVDKKTQGNSIEDLEFSDAVSVTGPGKTSSHGSANTETPAASILPEDDEDEESKEEHNAFVSRMEDLENMLTGDWEIQDEEIPTFEKIEAIARDHGELAAKEYVASLSQDQRETLAKERIAQVKLKHGGHPVLNNDTIIVEENTQEEQVE